MMTCGHKAKAALGNGKWSAWLPIADAQKLETSVLWGKHLQAAKSGQVVILPMRIAKELGVVAQ